VTTSTRRNALIGVGASAISPGLVARARVHRGDDGQSA
jgi:hypothetical protein